MSFVYGNSVPNNNRFMLSENFLRSLFARINTKLGRIVTRREAKLVSDFVRSLNSKDYEKHSVHNVIEYLSDHCVEKLANYKCGQENETLDMETILINQIGGIDTRSSSEGSTQANINNAAANTLAPNIKISSFLGMDELKAIASEFGSSNVVKHMTLLFDSRWRDTTFDSATSYRWTYSPTLSVTQSSVNSITVLKNIVSMKVSQIRIPYIDNADNSYRRITLFIQEFTNASTIGQEGRRHHFMFSPEFDDDGIELVPLNFNEGIFRFTEPQSNINTFTMSFGSPLETVTFDTDRSSGSVTNYGALTNIQTVTHGLTTGDRVYISNFGTLNNTRHFSFVNQINRSAGHIVSVISSTGFSVPVDTSTVRVLGAGTVSATQGSPIINGVGTAFNSLFTVGDYISISNVQYKINGIVNDTQLNLQFNYTGSTASGQGYYRDNIDYGTILSAYFASKRIFIQIEFSYLDFTKSN